MNDSPHDSTNISFPEGLYPRGNLARTLLFLFLNGFVGGFSDYFLIPMGGKEIIHLPKEYLPSESAAVPTGSTPGSG